MWAARRTYRHSLSFVVRREEIPLVLNSRGLLGEGAEVGVALGDYSEIVLKGWAGRLLISVDAWSVSIEDDPANPRVPQEVLDGIYADVCTRLGAFGDRSQVWKLESTEAAARSPPHSLDFVYIDAFHDYESVAADIAAWWDRVRPGGLLTGHDYHDRYWDGVQFGVKRAVDEFARARGLTVRETRRESEGSTSWMIVM